MEYIKSIIKNSIFVSTIFGVYYFLVYILSEKIPLPLEITSIPSLLVTVGFICILISSVISFYALLSSIITLDPFQINYYKCFYKTSKQIENEAISSLIGYFIYFILAPLTYLINYKLDLDNYISITYFILIPPLYSFYILTSDVSIFRLKFNFHSLKSSMFLYFKICFSYYMISVVSVVSFFIYSKLLIMSNLMADDYEFYVATFIFISLNYMSLIPSRPRNEFELISEKYGDKKISKSIFKLSVYGQLKAVVYGFVFVGCLYFPIASTIAGKTLYHFGVGGGVKRIYYYTPEARIRIPTQLQGHCDEDDYCYTIPVEVMLDIGDLLYVRAKGIGFDDLLFGLPGKQLYPIISVEKQKVLNEDKV